MAAPGRAILKKNPIKRDPDAFKTRFAEMYKKNGPINLIICEGLLLAKHATIKGYPEAVSCCGGVLALHRTDDGRG